MRSLDWCAIGDSLALGTAQAAGLLCNAKVGRAPKEVLGAIQSTDERCIAGRSVILSSGLSNNPNGWAYVPPQLDVLKSRGARFVVVLGVGPGVKPPGLNDHLKALTDNYGAFARFAGPLPPTRDVNTDQPGVHPWDYGDVVAQINALTGADL